MCALFLAQYFPEVDDGRPLKVVDFAPMASLSAFVRRATNGRTPLVVYRTADLLAPGVDDTVDLMDLKVYCDATVDFVICSHVLEHVTDDRRAIRELFRILKDGGQGIVLVPIVLGLEQIDEDPTVTDPTERWRRFGQDDHIRLYSKAGFVGRLREGGLTVRELGAHDLGLEKFALHGITQQSVLYIVEKSAGREPDRSAPGVVT
ncbi:Glycosyltransferase [Fimbriiglobus ruber]|uniref:Glycosyltransferase n=1 Tax=Fimbriiglobus ruber TaxID=1908690 RepID=A0A225E697_9BACT|nr:Glycosyltransferase [Fimbriiglobus ruber]